MPDIQSKNTVNESIVCNLVGDDILRIQVLNPDSTVKSELFRSSCPNGKVLNGNIMINGEIK